VPFVRTYMEKTKQSGGKRLKFSDGEQNMASIDRLSSLPDVVICHILSFLETKFSVATSVLGKRWRFLWAHVPCLDFYDDDFRDETQTSDIIHRVLLRHKAKTMDTFTLNVSCNDYQLETLITTAIDRNIRNLYLEHSLDRFPRYLFNCKTIVDLKLDDGCPSLSAVDNVSLPSLKKLYIFNLICENDDALPHFLSGCPSLEELNLAFEFAEESIYVGCINISSPTIKMLQLSMGMYALEYRVIINAPALRYLEVYDYDLECMTIPITMISLVEADICFDNYWFSKHKRKYSSTVMKFLHSLCYVKCLKISGSGFEKKLELDLHDLTCPSNLKYRMIINAPTLRYLQLDGCDSECITVPITMVSLVEADICLQSYHSMLCLKISSWEFEQFLVAFVPTLVAVAAARLLAIPVDFAQSNLQSARVYFILQFKNTFPLHNFQGWRRKLTNVGVKGKVLIILEYLLPHK
ncbi:F-box/RNI-like/FBD-like domains-containing protein, partial [Striga asiatica]